MSTSETFAYSTPRQIADRLGIAKVDTVLAWIHAGQLEAVNVSAGARPTWRIAEADLQAFLESRRAKPPAKVERRRKAKVVAGVTRYSDAM